jgi:hypothetical protein
LLPLTDQSTFLPPSSSPDDVLFSQRISVVLEFRSVALYEQITLQRPQWSHIQLLFFIKHCHQTWSTWWKLFAKRHWTVAYPTEKTVSHRQNAVFWWEMFIHLRRISQVAFQQTVSRTQSFDGRCSSTFVRISSNMTLFALYSQTVHFRWEMFIHI